MYIVALLTSHYYHYITAGPTPDHHTPVDERHVSARKYIPELIAQNERLLARLAVVLVDGVDVMCLLTSAIAGHYDRVTCGIELILLN